MNGSTQYLWIGVSVLATLLLCFGIGWLLMRRQLARIHALRIQAQKLRDADFGGPLLQTQGDALGWYVGPLRGGKHGCTPGKVAPSNDGKASS